MGERKIENLEQLPVTKEVQEAPVPKPDPCLILNYPEPTPISIILKDLTAITGRSFVLEPSQNRKIQIFSSRRLNADEAFRLFSGALSAVGLRAVEVGTVTKIVPIQGITLV